MWACWVSLRCVLPFVAEISAFWGLASFPPTADLLFACISHGAVPDPFGALVHGPAFVTLLGALHALLSQVLGLIFAGPSFAGGLPAPGVFQQLGFAVRQHAAECLILLEETLNAGKSPQGGAGVGF